MFAKLATDVRYAFRACYKNPLFTTVVVVTLGVGIGASAAIFSVVNGILLQELPYHQPDQLAILWQSDRINGTEYEGFSTPDYFDVIERNEVFEGMAAWFTGAATLTEPEADPATLTVSLVTPNLLPLLGLTPSVGRNFLADEAVPGAPNVALLSHRFWTSRFGGRPDAVGRIVFINDVSTEIIGVLPLSNAFPRPDVDIWTPLRITPSAGSRGNHGLQVIARLKEGVSQAAAAANLSAIATSLEEEYPADNEGRGMWPQDLFSANVGGVRTQLLVLSGAVVFVLLITCVNVANLLMARGTARSREIAIRLAMGVGKRRLLQQTLTESLVLATAGGTVGVVLAWLGVPALLALGPQLPRAENIGVNLNVVLFAGVVSCLTGIIFGMFPASQSTRTDLQGQLREGARAGGGVKQSVRKVLVSIEIAFAVLLVTGAGLLVKSFRNLIHVAPGFVAEQVVEASIVLPPSRYPQSRAQWPNYPEVISFQEELLARLNALPEVEVAAAALNGPTNPGWTSRLTIAPEPPFPPTPTEELRIRPITPDLLEVLRIPVLEGRGLTHADNRVDAHPVTLVNQAFARTYFGDESPIGSMVANWGVEREIVGVIPDIRFTGLGDAVPPAMYGAYASMPMPAFVVLARVRTDAEAVLPLIRQQVLAIDPDLPVTLSTLTDQMSTQVAQPRFSMLLFTIFAGVAVALAGVGIYGVTAFGVAQRTREIGVRLSLGAKAIDVVAHIMKEGVMLAVAGTVVGLLGAAALTQVMVSMLFEVHPLDPITLVAVAVMACVMAVAAALLPALRATRIDPITALRQD